MSKKKSKTCGRGDTLAKRTNILISGTISKAALDNFVNKYSKK